MGGLLRRFFHRLGPDQHRRAPFYIPSLSFSALSRRSCVLAPSLAFRQLYSPDSKLYLGTMLFDFLTTSLSPLHRFSLRPFSTFVSFTYTNKVLPPSHLLAPLLTIFCLVISAIESLSFPKFSSKLGV